MTKKFKEQPTTRPWNRHIAGEYTTHVIRAGYTQWGCQRIGYPYFKRQVRILVYLF